MKLSFATILLAILVSSQSIAASLTVPKYAKFEASFTLPNQTGNPYDPDQNDIEASFRDPSKKQMVVPAFWDGDRWRVRFAPTQLGVYSLYILRSGSPIPDPADLTASQFRCVPSRDPGFIRVDPNHAQHFVFDNGKSYYPQGIDLAWSGGGVPSYPEMLGDLGAAHMNWARVWMTYWDDKALEWTSDKSKNPPIGQYSLDAARRWDAIFDAAAANGVYIQMTLQHHGQYTAKVDPNWNDNPFNVKNGGFLQNPDDFFTDPEARKLTRAKYRYIVARWGYSTHLLSFELFNEVQNIREADNHFDDVVNWHKEMASTLRSIDVDHHLITTSNSDPGTPLAGIGLDYDQIHIYTPDITSYFSSLSAAGTSVPVFVGEWGPQGNSGTMPVSFLHDGIWSSIMAPVAGQGQFWFWDETLKNNWWPQFKSATSFVHAFNIDALTGFTSVRPKVTSTGARTNLTFTPPGGWAPNTRFDVPVSSDGTMPDLSGLSYFIQGNSHRDMLAKSIKFDLNAQSPCKFIVSINSTSAGGSHPRLTVDGANPVEMDFPPSGKNTDVRKELSIDVPAGAHSVELFNTGSDWFTLRRITITNYAPAVGVLAKQNGRSVVFWAYNRDRETNSPASASLVLSGLPGGKAEVHLWDPWKGEELRAPDLRRQGTNTIINLPGIDRDIAGVVVVR